MQASISVGECQNVQPKRRDENERQTILDAPFQRDNHFSLTTITQTQQSLKPNNRSNQITVLESRLGSQPNDGKFDKPKMGMYNYGIPGN